MGKQKHGGPAFPNSRHVGELTVVDGGMTLRDYFAAKALQAIIREQGLSRSESCKTIDSIHAYGYADAMITERNKGDSQC